MVVSREQLLQRYRQLDTEELMQLIAGQEMSEVAWQSVRQTLTERGVIGDAVETAYVSAVKAMHRRSGVTNECDFCGKSVVFGPILSEGQRFCSDKCLDLIRVHEVAVSMEPALILERAHAIRFGECPMCVAQDGSVEVRYCHYSASLLIELQNDRISVICCRRCGARKAYGAAAYTFLLGWWSVRGLLRTPLVIWRNFKEVGRLDSVDEATPELREEARLTLARELLEVRRNLDSEVLRKALIGS